MAISTADRRGVFTKRLLDVYQERSVPTEFLRSMFKVELVPTKEVSIEVERMGEWIAVDILRGTEGQRNTFSRSTEKIFEPPLYKEFFDATELDIYDRVLGSQGTDNTQLFAALLNRVANRIGTLQDKIDRATELQCAQILHNGIVTLKNGDNIDYKRKAASIVINSANYFDTAIDPFVILTSGCQFLRQVGKSPDVAFRALMGESTLAALLTNAKFLTRQNQFNMALDAVVGPVANSVGATYHGTLTCGSYKVELWCYPQSYDTKDPVTNVVTYNKYLNDKEVVLVPKNPRFRLAYGAVPQLVGEPGEMPMMGQYKLADYIDYRKTTHEFEIASAPLAIPVAVDQIFTFQAVS